MGSIKTQRLACGFAASLCVAVGGGPALAQTQAAPEALASENLAVNLVELLVKQGVISRTAGDQLLKQAEQETLQARAAHAGAVALPNGEAMAPATQMAALPPAPAGVVRVPYVPQIVRDQIRDEIKGEVMQQAKAEGWAQPGSLPDWLSRISISGDVRLRSEYDLYSKNNSHGQTGALIDYASFNSNGPTDIIQGSNPNLLIPYLNTVRSRYNDLSIRARLAVDAKLSDAVGAGLRLGTGNSNGPTSTTSLLSGGFAKTNIWVDRAYIWFKPTSWATLTGGRMPNPFQSTDLIYSDDLNFDGVDGRFTYDLPQRDLHLSVVSGAFPLGYQNPNFPTLSIDKSFQRQSWLFAGQAGVEWSPVRFDWKSTVAFYDFSNVRGELSAPCPIYSGIKQCATDFTVPPAMTWGNTLFLIRDIDLGPNLSGAQPQLAGLSFAYRLIDLNTSFDYRLDLSHHLVFTGEYVRNVAYNWRDVCRNTPAGLPVNNLEGDNSDPCDTPAAGDTKARFRSGPNAFLVKLLYGDPDPTRFGEWNIGAGYRYIQPDALLDGYNSPDFHLGGTNAKGYTLTATMGLFSGAYLQARWFSADQVYGPPLAIDVGQLDLHVRF